MKKALKAGALLIAGAVTFAGMFLVTLWWDARQIKDDYFDTRKGTLTIQDVNPEGIGEVARLQSDSGLAVQFRSLRPLDADNPVPVLLVLGGHRTGSKAVELFGQPAGFAIVAVDYPYDGPARIRGVPQALRHLPAMRRALLDIPPALSLLVDWLHTQAWAEKERIVLAGVSLGVPFATTAAARDERLSELWLVHGAADNRLWLQANIARRIDFRAMHFPLATILHWLANGPTFNTAARIADIAPRPVLIIGARDDERTPAGQTEKLFAAAREPRELRWTDGPHIEPGRRQVLDALLEIAVQELTGQEASR